MAGIDVRYDADDQSDPTIGWLETPSQ